ncbi:MULTISPECIES: hypothetical protein [Vibrio]|uniref:hypothetical protein n=2 Tax=Vibrionaceae TaxID=641 RepID=UPI0002FAA8BB|nr:hypothetical protein [Vibrio tasmaniensis]OEF78429.1 hypothetical protein A162_16370 [Vibrio tasmaniensis 1F-155]PMO78748.1 hypothetical protein BCT01_12030 [Vibrio tasmaniensis]
MFNYGNFPLNKLLIDGVNMDHDNRLHFVIYGAGSVYVLIQYLGFTAEEATLSQGVASVSGSIERPELLPWFLIVIGVVCALILIVRGMVGFFSKFKTNVLNDARLLRKAKEEVRENTGIDYPVGKVDIKSLFNPTALLGMWMTSKGTYSRYLSVTLNPITYLWLLLVSLIKTFLVNGGFYLYFTPLLFSAVPLMHGLWAIRSISI